MQTNCEAEAITSIYSPSVRWLSSYTSRCCSSALWRTGGSGRVSAAGGGGGEGKGGGTQAACYEGWVMWGRDAGHSVTQRVASSHSAAGRGFTAKKEENKK